MESHYIEAYRKALMLKNMAQSTIDCYISVVQKFLSAFNISPQNINEQQIIDYILKYDKANTKAQQIGALKHFYSLIIKQPLKFRYIPYPRKEYHEPEILSVEEMRKLIQASKANLKHFTIVCLLYSTGIRVSETINLKLSDINRNLMCFHIRQAKGTKTGKFQ